MEFIIDETGIPFFLEINCRNDDNAYCLTASGVYLPWILVAYSLGIDIQDEINKQVKPITVMPVYNDFKLAITGKLPFRIWLKDIERTDSFVVWNKNDKRPFFIIF